MWFRDPFFTETASSNFFQLKHENGWRAFRVRPLSFALFEPLVSLFCSFRMSVYLCLHLLCMWLIDSAVRSVCTRKNSLLCELTSATLVSDLLPLCHSILLSICAVLVRMDSLLAYYSN